MAVENGVGSVSLYNVLPATPTDPFNTLEIEMPYKSGQLLYHCESVISYHLPLAGFSSTNIFY